MSPVPLTCITKSTTINVFRWDNDKVDIYRGVMSDEICNIESIVNSIIQSNLELDAGIHNISL